MVELNPTIQHPLFASIKYKEALVTTLYRGTQAMRAAGTTYLPQEPKEKDINYALRLNRSVLFPAYKQAVQSNTGKLFMHDIEVANSSTEMDNILLEVDQDNNDITEFAKSIAEQAIHQGCSYILVDFPVMASDASLADERVEGGRPYWMSILQSEVFEASPTKRNGKRILGVFRYKEKVAVRVDEFTVKYIDQIKQFSFNKLNEVIYKIYRQDVKNNTKWILFENGMVIANGAPLDEIPVVAVNVNSVGFYLGEPVFYDLAEESCQHWQMRSDYNNIVHHSQCPKIVVTGDTTQYNKDGVEIESAVSMSINSITDLPEGATMDWLEVKGTSAKVGADALATSYELMASMSLQLLTNSEAATTATASTIDAVESLSRLQSIGKTVSEALNKAIIFTYKYLGTNNKITTVTLDVTSAVEMTQDLSSNNTNNTNNATKASSGGNADTYSN